MNYRHIYHAGNFADVIKHLTFVLALDYLQKKDAPLCVIDAHGGLGLYDLASEQAQKTKEWEAGIGRFAEGTPPDDFNLYYKICADDLRAKFYPGSPLLAARMLRPQDRLIANELHPDDVQTLQENLRGFSNARVTRMDAYECLRAHLPPLEKRGVILIDPPFEKTDEFQTLIRQMQEWKKRFATGVFLLWYPIKAHLPVEALKDAVRDLSFPRTWCIEALLHPAKQAETFNGSGLILFNAPFGVPERVAALLPYLKDRLGLHAHPHAWLTPS
jgi:23S rRNA (adenine2030-N6)-methyltransferase